MAAPGRPNTLVTPSRRRIATAASAAGILGIALLLSSGQLLDQFEQRRVVQTAVTLGLQRRDQLGRGGSQGDHPPGFAGGGGDDAEVLVVQGDAETGGEVAGQHGRSLALQHRAAGQAAAQHAQGGLGVDAVSLREGIASASRPRCPATSSWLAALTVCPEPAGPTGTIVWPTASNTGWAAAKSSAAPPTMIDSVPSTAPASPPETGASSIRKPRSWPAVARSAATSGRMVEKSMISAFAGAWANTPSSPVSTARTSGESGTMVATTSASRPASAMLLAPWPPASTSRSTLAGLRL